MHDNTQPLPALSLSAVVGADSFFYSIKDPGTNRHRSAYLRFADASLPFEEPLNFLPALFERESMLYANFAKVSIAFAESPYFLAEAGTLHRDVVNSIASNAFFTGFNDRMFYKYIPGTGKQICFTVPGKMIDELSNFFGSFYSTHVVACLLQHTAQNPVKGESHIDLYLHTSRFLINIWKSQRLVYSRDFPLTTDEDVLFFVHAAASMFSLQPVDTMVILSGPGARESLMARIKAYYPLSRTLAEKTETRGVPIHRMIDLISLEACVS